MSKKHKSKDIKWPDVNEALTMRHIHMMSSQMDDMIKYLRYLEELSNNGGMDVLDELLLKGHITLLMYVRIKRLIENPELKYKITII